MTTRSARMLGAVLLVALAAGGCSLIFQKPTVRVAEVSLTSLDLRGGEVAVVLSIDNPNRFALNGEDFQYELAFADQNGGTPTWLTLAEGRVTEPIRIPAQDVGTVEVVVPFGLSALGGAVSRLLRSGELDYRFTGEVRFGTPAGSARVPFDERGTFRP